MPRSFSSLSIFLRPGSVLWVGVFLSLSVWVGCGGGGPSKLAAPVITPAVPAPTTPPGAMPVNFWGLHVLDVADFPTQVPYGEFRAWDTQAQWPQIDPTCAPNPASNPISLDPCFTWTTFDQELSNLLSDPFSISSVTTFQVNDILYTLNRTPQWASSDPTDNSCNNVNPAPGQCDLPGDISPDGSGTNQTWKTWVTAIATHANGLDNPSPSSYTSTHAHIKYWEPWNEWYRNPVVTDWTGVVSAKATYAEMLRLTEDARCIITGKGTIHNYPTAGASTLCTATAIDPTALIVTPSSASDETAYQAVMQNFLYCNGVGAVSAPFPNSFCNWNGQNWGSEAVDIIDFHFYASSEQPENVVNNEIPAIRAFLDAADLAKPLWSGEGSWGVITNPTDLWGTDAYARAGFIARMFALYWSAGVTENFFYSYESFLFQPSAGALIQPEGAAWNTTYSWLADGTPTQNPFCQQGQSGFSPTVYSCPFKRAGGNAALLVWDPQYGPGGTSSLANCTSSVTPLICGTTSITVPSTYTKDWIDISGTVHPAASTLTIGANPILLEAP